MRQADFRGKQLKTDIQNLENFQKITSEFKKFDDLDLVLNDADENLKDIKSNFNECIDISLKFESIINEYNEFLSRINVDLKKIPENYSYDDFKLIQNKISYNIVLLLKNQKYCFQFLQVPE